MARYTKELQYRYNIYGETTNFYNYNLLQKEIFRESNF